MYTYTGVSTAMLCRMRGIRFITGLHISGTFKEAAKPDIEAVKPDIEAENRTLMK